MGKMYHGVEGKKCSFARFCLLFFWFFLSFCEVAPYQFKRQRKELECSSLAGDKENIK